MSLESCVFTPETTIYYSAGTSPGFDIKRDCIFCGLNQGSIGKKTENLLSDVSDIGTLNSVLEKIAKRDDNWGRQVQIRISGFNDLIAPEAKYHRKCHSNFFMMKQNPVCKNLVTSTRGRPINERLSFRNLSTVLLHRVSGWMSIHYWRTGEVNERDEWWWRSFLGLHWRINSRNTMGNRW